MSKLNEAERDGAAAARQIHALKNTIGRLNIVGVPFCSCLYYIVLLNSCLKKIMLLLLRQQTIRKSGGI